MLEVFQRIDLDKKYSSVCECLEYMVNEMGNPDLDFARFIKIVNDYYS